MSSQPEVGVVIPSHNRRALLARTLRGVLAQRDVALQVVVVDDGSADDTSDYVTGLGDARVTLVRHEVPRGVSAARNSGIERCFAPWVAFSDDDDVWSPVKLRAQLDALAAHGRARWATTGSVRVYGEDLRILFGEPVPRTSEVADVLLKNNIIPGGASSVLASTELVREVGGFDTRMSNLADWDMWIRLGLRSPLAVVPRPLVGYYTHVGSMAGNVDSALQDLGVIREKHRSAIAARGVEPSLENLLWYLSALQLRAGRRVGAARVLLRLVPLGRPAVHAFRNAAVGLVWPGLQRYRDRRDERALSPEWRCEAEAWLTAFRFRRACSDVTNHRSP
ncbi:Glycosyl transferase family 2 [Geodermatophilus africanus]|uniref:Glycosyl transferase family 2 n=1 Tax=Geodermatophilus africanus TaxID=1137993 RepID=A0A1H3Q771_9ACTN|nr:glycosyltransferase family 2 protein [Geodermatophilus africanus]SDZ09206.1 Glycosyl transferase family 2 [Geodermatophilus africanus]